MMNNFEFYIPTTAYFGEGQIEKLPVIKKYGSRVLLVYGGGSIKRNGLYDKAVSLLKDAGMEVYEIGGVEPNPRITLVREAVKIVKEHAVDMVLAIGGGSSIDSAKLIAAGAKYEGDPWDLMMNSSLIQEALPIHAILTLAATGSEMDNSTVITNPETKEKIDIVSRHIIPTTAFMDPTYTYSVSKLQTASGAVDMFSHILEEYLTHVEGATLQLRMCEATMKTIIEWARVAVDEPENYDARANLMYASSMALNGVLFYGSEVDWSVHPIEHVISAHYDLTHGVGMGILYPAWMRQVLNEETAPALAVYGRNVFTIDPFGMVDDMEVAKEAIDRTEEFFASLDIPMHLSEVGIDDSKFGEMAEQCGAISGDAFAALSVDDIKEILYKAL